MEFTASQIAGFLQGSVEGDPEARVNNLAKIEEGTPGTLTFLANPKYTPFIYTTGSSVIVVNRDFVAAQPVKGTLVRVADAYSAFAQLMSMFGDKGETLTGVAGSAYIAQTATIGREVTAGEFSYIGSGSLIADRVSIYPQVYIGENVKIGAGSVIYPGVRIYRDCLIGAGCIIHSGAVIGSDGFGFAPQTDSDFRKIPQLGNVVLEDNVEIGSNTTIDRATLGSTILRRGVKLDNLIQVAHNVEIGENTVIAAQTGISGSTRIGKNCMIGGQVGIVGHITIADNVKIGAQSGIEASILTEGAIVLGSPAIEAGKARRNYIHWRNLDSIIKKVYQLEKTSNKKHE